MTPLFDGEPWVHYGQLYLETTLDQEADFDDSFAGQLNGFCGASVPGCLFLLTDLHTGRVGLTAELLASPPPDVPGWEDVAEVSFRPAGTDVRLVEWAGQAAYPLELEQTWYRVRYSATGMDAGRALDTRPDDHAVVDRYLLQFWPEPASPDRVVRQTSASAAYWHSTRRPSRGSAHFDHP